MYICTLEGMECPCQCQFVIAIFKWPVGHSVVFTDILRKNFCRKGLEVRVFFRNVVVQWESIVDPCATWQFRPCAGFSGRTKFSFVSEILKKLESVFRVVEIFWIMQRREDEICLCQRIIWQRSIFRRNIFIDDFWIQIVNGRKVRGA